MKLIILLATLILALFGCISVSQSYASAQQARVVIETNQTAQLALSGQIATSIAFALIALVLLITLLFLAYLLVKKISSQKLYLTQEGLTHKQLRLPVSWEEEGEEFITLPSDWGW